MSACQIAGWGSGAYGMSPWAGAPAAPGGPLPVESPFDIYCVGPCGPMAVILTHPDVATYGDPSHFNIDPFSEDLVMSSGGGITPPDNGQMVITSPVPGSWTLDFTGKLISLPTDFLDIANSHLFVGASDAQGVCAGLFLSKIGLAYTGSVHVDGGGTLVLDTPVQPLPNSQLLIAEGEYYSFRIAVSETTGVTYIFVTKSSELLSIGHQLRYVLPAIESASAAQVPPDQTNLSVRGTVALASTFSLDTICLGSGLLIPNIPPRADAGPDQAVRTCSVLRLDGSRSFDPEGAPLTYSWRLVDGPANSQYVFVGADGLTQPLAIPTGFTNRFYSSSLQSLNGLDPISVGDVLLLGTKVHVIQSVGSDMSGFYVMVDAYDLPDNLSTATTFHYVRQRGINNRTSMKPTFYPDVPGLFRFDLIVFDGGLFSEPSVTVCDVVESAVARGCTPDLSFIWNYLSDFWKLIDDKERIETLWGGLTQVAASEMLNLWQTEYSKSIRDIQRTLQRKWLHYDLLLAEDLSLIELQTFRTVYSGLESIKIPTAGLALAGTHLDLQLGTKLVPTVISFAGPDPVLPATVLALVQQALAQVDRTVTARLVPYNDATGFKLRIDAAFPITVLAATTSTLYAVGDQNGLLKGTAGVAFGINSYSYRTDRSLQGLDLQPGDFLMLGDVGYPIVSVVDDPGDPFPFMRVTTSSPIPTPWPAVWSIASRVTSQTLDFYNGLVTKDDVATFEIIRETDQQVLLVTAPALGACADWPHTLAVDLTPVGAYLAQPNDYKVFLRDVTRRTYLPLDPLVVDIPYLQERIKNADDKQALRRNVDYYIESYRGSNCAHFTTAASPDPDVWQYGTPPARMWAEYTYLDNTPAIEGNFGIPAGFTLDDHSLLPSNVDYLSSVRGLWYTYFNGPTVQNLQAGTQILLGLPFAEEIGVITEIRSDFSSTQGRILVQDVANPELIRSYTYPASLSLYKNPATGVPYVVGDTVQQFAPLTDGVEVKDYVSDPSWFEGYLQQGAFLEVEKFFKFLVRVDSHAFNLPALLFVQNFVLRVKPRYTYPVFVVLVGIGDTEVSTTTSIALHGTLRFNDGPCYNLGGAGMFDQPRPAGGGWRNQFDHNDNPATPPAYPAPNYPIVWAFDRNALCPEDAIMGKLSTIFAAPALPVFDSIFQFDMPVYTSVAATFTEGQEVLVPAGGLMIGDPVTIGAPGALNTITLDMAVLWEGSPNNYNLVLQVNGVDASVTPFLLTSGTFRLAQAVAVAVLAGDVLTAFIRPVAAVDTPVYFTGATIEVGQAVYWAFDVLLPAATYFSYREM